MIEAHIRTISNGAKTLHELEAEALCSGFSPASRTLLGNAAARFGWLKTISTMETAGPTAASRTSRTRCWTGSKMAATEINLRSISRGLVVAPAGCGKTQLITNAIARHDGSKPILVLTHTNAGVAALRGRLQRVGVKPSAYRATTLDGFAIRLISTFPQRAGHDPRIVNGARPNYVAIRDTAARLVAAGHLNDVLAASFAHLFVDEYQDCSIRQHSLVTWLAQSLPTAIVGDPFQSIFGFGGDPLADWQAESSRFFRLRESSRSLGGGSTRERTTSEIGCWPYGPI